MRLFGGNPCLNFNGKIALSSPGGGGMMVLRFFLFLFLLSSSFTFSLPLQAKSFFVSQVTPDCEEWGFFYFCGDIEHAETLQAWLDEIHETSVGQKVLKKINESPNRLLIRHSTYSVLTAGKTLAPLTFNLTNGIGEDVVIEMNFNIPEQGSHIVRGLLSRDYIPFTAVQNLFHELVHAKHKMRGTLEIIRIEEQAIKEENIFRVETSKKASTLLRDGKAHADGIQIWFPASQN